MHYKQGFTIVELLIVIVVIAILAAIATVSYTGITTRATDAIVRADLNTLAKQVEAYKVTEGQYPPVINSGALYPMPEMETVLKRAGLYQATRFVGATETAAKSYVFCSSPDASRLYIISVAPIIKATSMASANEAVGKKLVYYSSVTQSFQEATFQIDASINSLQMNICKSAIPDFSTQTWTRRWSFDIPDAKAGTY